MKKVKLSEVPYGKLFRGAKQIWRKVNLRMNFPPPEYAYAINWPALDAVFIYSTGNPEVELLNDDGTEVVERVEFRCLDAGEKFKFFGKTFIKSTAIGWAIDGIDVQYFHQSVLVEMV